RRARSEGRALVRRVAVGQRRVRAAARAAGERLLGRVGVRVLALRRELAGAGRGAAGDALQLAHLLDLRVAERRVGALQLRRLRLRDAAFAHALVDVAQQLVAVLVLRGLRGRAAE